VIVIRPALYPIIGRILLAGLAAEARQGRAPNPEVAHLAHQLRDVTPTRRPPGLLDRHEAAAHLGVSVTTVDRLRKRGDLVATYVGAAPRFHLDDLDRVRPSRQSSSPVATRRHEPPDPVG